MKKSIIRKPISILLSLLLALSVFGGTAFSASADYNSHSESFILMDHIYDKWQMVGTVKYAEDFETEHFSVNGYPYHEIVASGGWQIQNSSYYNVHDYVTIKARNDETIKRLVINTDPDISSPADPYVTAEGPNLPFTKSGGTYTFENVNATEVTITADSYSDISRWNMIILSIDVYYSYADAVVKLINMIGEVKLTNESKAKIDAAREAYDALNLEFQLDVTNYDVLLAAEKAYADLLINSYKENAISELEGYVDLNDYRETERGIILQLIEVAKSFMNDLDSFEDIDRIVEQAKESIDTQKTDAQLTAEELLAAKADAKAELENYKDMSDYREAQQLELADVIRIGKAEIDRAGSIAEVESALAAAKAAADEIKTDAQLTAEELLAAKADAKAELEEYKDPADYREAQQAELTDVIMAGKAAIDAAEDVAAVESAFADALAAADAIKTDAQLTAEEAAVLLAAKADAKAELEEYKDPADYREAQQAELADVTAAGKAAIDAAEDVAAVESALAAAKAAADSIKTDAQLTAEEEAAAELLAAKENAKSELEEYKDPADYREAQRTELADVTAAGKAAIDAAEDVAAVESALAAAKAAADAIKTDAQLTAEEASQHQGDDPTDEPENPSSDNVCKWCHRVHTGFWGKIVGFFHSIFYFFAHLFSR